MTSEQVEEQVKKSYLEGTGFEKLDKRRDLALWVFLYKTKVFNIEEMPTYNQALEDLNQHLIFSEGNISDVYANLIPIEDLSWVMNNRRQLEWVRGVLISLYPGRDTSHHNLPENYLAGLSHKSQIILIIDLLNESRQGKIKVARDLAKDWQSLVLTTKGISWFDTDRESKTECLHRALDKLSINMWNRQGLTNRESIEILHDEIVDRSGPLSWQEVIRQTKSYYRKRTFKKRHSDKKQCNVLLSISLINQLDKKATNRGVKRAQLIQKILMEAMNDDSLFEQLLKGGIALESTKND